MKRSILNFKSNQSQEQGKKNIRHWRRIFLLRVILFHRNRIKYEQEDGQLTRFLEMFKNNYILTFFFIILLFK